VVWAAGLALLFHCGSSVHYTPAQDTAAMALVTNTWSGEGVTLSLCEDLATAAAADTDPSPCGVEHVVRGGGRGRDYEAVPGGCGGCPRPVQAYVVGTLADGALGAPLDVAGIVHIGSGYDDDSYRVFPYRLELCTVTGTLDEQGVLTLEPGAGTALQRSYALPRTATATCP
jgi:hypothetical protein